MPVVPTRIELLTPADYKNLRTLLRRNQAEAAAMTGVHANTWAAWERGTTTPQPRHYEGLGCMLRLAGLLEQPAEYDKK